MFLILWLIAGLSVVCVLLIALYAYLTRDNFPF